MSDDYGYFGKGSSGYAHYTQSFDSNFKRGGGGRGPSPNSGCLTSIVMAFAVMAAIVILFII